MSTQRTSSSAIAPALEGITTALKIAREATDAVPIAKQILGAAANIFELAEKIEKKRQAMTDLVLSAGDYAQQIDVAAAGRVVDAKMQRRLERLYTVFTKIEALMQRETAPKNAAIRALHKFVVLPLKAEALGLSSELEREMKVFQLSSSIDTRLAVADTARILEEDSQYDGEFRRLRHGDVQKLDILHEYFVDAGVLTFARARVNSELMIVRYLDKTNTAVSGVEPYGNRRKSHWTSYPEFIGKISTVHASHPNVVQLYGTRPGPEDSTFAVFRSGTRRMSDFILHLRSSSPADTHKQVLVTMILSYKILDAAWHLQDRCNVMWFGDTVTFDEAGEPYIGALDDLEDTAVGDRDHAVKNAATTLRMLIQPPPLHHVEAHRVVEEVYDGRLFQSLASSDVPHAQKASQLWELLRREILEVDVQIWLYPSHITQDHVGEPSITHARELLTNGWEGWALDGFNDVIRHIFLQRPLLHTPHVGMISIDPWGTNVSIRHITEHADQISVERIEIRIPEASGLRADILQILQIESSYNGTVHLDQIQCYKNHEDCGFSADCSGPRLNRDDWFN